MAMTTYIWDELSDNVVAEFDDGVLSAAYTHEPGLYGNLLSQNRNGVTSYYHYDGRGDTVALTDDSGNVTDTKQYDAWGNVIASTGSTVVLYQFVGRQGYQVDGVIKAFSVRNRTFMSLIARWLSYDTMAFADGINRFAYCHDNPIMGFDPSGNKRCVPLFSMTTGPTKTRIDIIDPVANERTLGMIWEFGTSLWFNSPCDCCDFKQDRACTSWFEFPALGNKTTVILSSRDGEDCSDFNENGVIDPYECFGSKIRNPNPRLQVDDKWENCHYEMTDLPVFRINEDGIRIARLLYYERQKARPLTRFPKMKVKMCKSCIFTQTVTDTLSGDVDWQRIIPVVQCETFDIPGDK